jgi:hypothetical protein
MVRFRNERECSDMRNVKHQEPLRHVVSRCQQEKQGGTVQAVNRRRLNTKVRVELPVISCGICSRKRGMRQIFSAVSIWILVFVMVK